MLDISKKYWVVFGPFNVLCSVRDARVVINLGQENIFNFIEDLDISIESKNKIRSQVGIYSVPTATKDDASSIKMIEELEALDYIVFYDVDEPLGHSVSEDEMELDTPPPITLEEYRKLCFESIANSWERAGESRPEMPDYPVKEYGKEWYYFE